MSQDRLTSDRAVNAVVLESYGVRVKIEASSPELLRAAEETARTALLGRIEILENVEAEHSFGIFEDKDQTLLLLQDGEQISSDAPGPRFFRFFDSLFRIMIAEHAKDRVFIHAGVVGWKNKAIVIPANSFRGKTTLVAELVKHGAVYYSDEYAIVDELGLIHPFPRDLSVRYFDGETREKRVKPEMIGARIGSLPIPVGLTLITEYEEKAVWKPRTLTAGQGIIEIIPHTIPRRANTKFSLKVLNTAFRDAIILKSFRGEASEFAIDILSFFDNYLNLA